MESLGISTDMAQIAHWARLLGVPFASFLIGLVLGWSVWGGQKREIESLERKLRIARMRDPNILGEGPSQPVQNGTILVEPENETVEPERATPSGPVAEPDTVEALREELQAIRTLIGAMPDNTDAVTAELDRTDVDLRHASGLTLRALEALEKDTGQTDR